MTGSYRIEIYDTTLRDVTQREGISLSRDDKLRIAGRLDRLGVAFIEGGWPGSNPKDAEFFRRVKDMSWETARIAAFGSTRRPGCPPVGFRCSSRSYSSLAGSLPSVDQGRPREAATKITGTAFSPIGRV